jgi:hypothetical protein
LELLRAAGADGVLIAGVGLPFLLLRLTKSPKAVGLLSVAGFGVAAFFVFRWLIAQSPLGAGLFVSASFLWAMAGFSLFGFCVAVIMGTFATDAPRSPAETRKMFWIGFSATLGALVVLGVPFACLVRRPETLWLRPLLAPYSLFVIIALISPISAVMNFVAASRIQVDTPRR